MSAHWNSFLELLTTAGINLSTDMIKVRIGRSSAYTFSQVDEFASALPAAIVTDVTLGSKVLVDGTLDAADAVFASVPAGAALDRLWIFKDTGVSTTSPLIAEITGFSVTPNGGDITIQWQATSPFIFKV